MTDFSCVSCIYTTQAHTHIHTRLHTHKHISTQRPLSVHTKRMDSRVLKQSCLESSQLYSRSHGSISYKTFINLRHLCKARETKQNKKPQVFLHMYTSTSGYLKWCINHHCMKVMAVLTWLLHGSFTYHLLLESRVPWFDYHSSNPLQC